MEEALGKLFSGDTLQVMTSVVGTAAVIAATLPSPKARGIIGFIRKLIDIFAFNFGNAKNRDTE